MVDGREYVSIVGKIPRGQSLDDDIKRALSAIEEARGRPCVCYVANVVNP